MLENLNASSMMYYRAIEWCSQFRLATQYGIAVDVEGEEKLRDTSAHGQERYAIMFGGDHAAILE